MNGYEIFQYAGLAFMFILFSLFVLMFTDFKIPILERIDELMERWLKQNHAWWEKRQQQKNKPSDSSPGTKDALK